MVSGLVCSIGENHHSITLLPYVSFPSRLSLPFHLFFITFVFLLFFCPFPSLSSPPLPSFNFLSERPARVLPFIVVQFRLVSIPFHFPVLAFLHILPFLFLSCLFLSSPSSDSFPIIACSFVAVPGNLSCTYPFTFLPMISFPFLSLPLP